MVATVRTDAIVDDILVKFASGTRLRDAVSEAGIGWQTWHNWVDKDQQLRDRFKAASIMAAHAASDRAEQILDEPVTQTDKVIAMAEMTRRRELANHLRWKAMKLAPATYSDKHQIDLTGKTVSLVDVLTTIGIPSLTEAHEMRARARSDLDLIARNNGTLIPHSDPMLPAPAVTTDDDQAR
jgi:hypothetical protein